MSKKEQNKTLNQRLKRAQINDEAEVVVYILNNFVVLAMFQEKKKSGEVRI